jgi:hypothetical protein
LRRRAVEAGSDGDDRDVVSVSKHFGKNYDALYDCLTDSSRRPAHSPVS